METLETDGDIRVVNISKKFWYDNLTEIEESSELAKRLEDRGAVKALLIYKMNESIKLVPYLRKTQKPDLNEVF